MTEINVYGNALTEIVPDIFILNVTVGTKGYLTMDTAKENFSLALNGARLEWMELDPKMVNERSVTNRSWHDRDKDTDYYTVSTNVSIKFPSEKMDKANEIMKRLIGLYDVSVSTYWNVSSQLMKVTNDRLLGEAALDARSQVAAVAAALGLEVVKPILIAEPSLFPTGGEESYGRSRGGVFGSSLEAGAAPGMGFDDLELNMTPELVEVSVRMAVSYLVE